MFKDESLPPEPFIVTIIVINIDLMFDKPVPVLSVSVLLSTLMDAKATKVSSLFRSLP